MLRIVPFLIRNRPFDSMCPLELIANSSSNTIVSDVPVEFIAPLIVPDAGVLVMVVSAERISVAVVSTVKDGRSVP